MKIIIGVVPIPEAFVLEVNDIDNSITLAVPRGDGLNITLYALSTTGFWSVYRERAGHNPEVARYGTVTPIYTDTPSAALRTWKIEHEGCRTLT